MKRLLLVLAVLALALGLWTQSGPASAQQYPVSLDLVDVYVVVLQDGRLNVRYSLTFTELEGGRDRIRELGPFPQDHTITGASGSGPDGAFPVSLSGSGPIYQVDLGLTTERNKQYTVQVNYTVNRSVFDATEVEGQSYRVIGWAPFQWSLPIERQELRYVLPIELPEGITDAFSVEPPH